MLQLDYTLFIQIANFLLLMLLLNVILYKPIRKILGKRREEIDAFQGMIENFHGQSAGYAKKIEEGIAEARKVGTREKEGLKKNGQEEEKQMLRDASGSAAEKMEKARKELDEKLVTVRQSLEGEMALFSRELAEKVLGRSL